MAEAATTLRLTRELIARRSITPEDEGCQELLGERLARLGFKVEPVRRGEVTNLWARRGKAAPVSEPLYSMPDAVAVQVVGEIGHLFG